MQFSRLQEALAPTPPVCLPLPLPRASGRTLSSSSQSLGLGGQERALRQSRGLSTPNQRQAFPGTKCVPSTIHSGSEGSAPWPQGHVSSTDPGAVFWAPGPLCRAVGSTARWLRWGPSYCPPRLPPNRAPLQGTQTLLPGPPAMLSPHWAHPTIHNGGPNSWSPLEGPDGHQGA